MSSDLAFIIALLLVIIVPIALIVFIKSEKVLKITAIVLLVIYVGIMLIGVWTNVSTPNGVLKIGFDFDAGWCNKSIRWGIKGLQYEDVIINILMFVPIGNVFYLFKQHKPFKKVLLWSLVIGLIMGFTVELGQFVFPLYRAPQTTDVALNGISFVLGSLLGKAYINIRAKRFGKNNFI